MVVFLRCWENGRRFLLREVMTMAITLTELLAVLTLLVDVVTVCYLVFSKNQK